MVSTHVMSARELMDKLTRAETERSSDLGPGREPALDLVLAGATPGAVATLKPGVAGYGSQVVLEDRASGDVETYVLMNADAMDLERGHVSIEAPLGSQLLGVTPGQEVAITLPGGRRVLHVVAVRTLYDTIES